MDVSNARILIVDDVSRNIQVLGGLLRKEGYKVEFAQNAQDALAWLDAEKFDLILLDIMMPKVDGFELCHVIKSDKRHYEIPVIFLTAKNASDDIVRGFESGGVDYVTKPFNGLELIERVRTHLNLRFKTKALEKDIELRKKMEAELERTLKLVYHKNEELNLLNNSLTKEIEERKRIEKELVKAKNDAEKASKAKSMFLASMSHEIRTPMSGIIGMLDILKQYDINSEQKEHLSVIEVSAQNLLTIINDILDFSKIEAGQIELENIDFHLHNLVNDVVRMLVYKAEAKNLKLVQHIGDEVPNYLKGDVVRLKQILINLMNNAIKFSEYGDIRLSVEFLKKENKSVWLKCAVSDEGIGISEEGKKNLFKDYHQIGASTTRKYGGTGLGLAISKRIAELMSGEIGCESELGKGSTFWFTVCLLEASKPPIKGSADLPGKEMSLKQPLSILLAEDNAINQKIALINLKKMGHRAELAENGAIAVELYKNGSFDLILMDEQMPSMSGIEATRMIRKIEAAKEIKSHIPIIALTANAMKGERERFLAAGMDDYLSKPFKIDDLKEVIARAAVFIKSLQSQSDGSTKTSDSY